MYVPMPALAAIAFAFLVLALLALRRRGGDRDLIAPPPQRSSVPAPHPGLSAGGLSGMTATGDLPPEIVAEVRAMIAAGRKIQAIKRVREQTGLGLAEAKNLVERM